MTMRRDTKLESEGAEFLVLGKLLIEGIITYKAYINYPGYDLIAINQETEKIARIQVKSRWATDYDGSFPLKSLECDFVVHVALNRGYTKERKKNLNKTGIDEPTYYIFPTDLLKEARKDTGWKKVQIKKIPDFTKYIGKWNLIKDFLTKKEKEVLSTI